LSISYNSAQFFWYDFFTKSTYDIWPARLKNANQHKFFYDFICGGLAAAMTIVTNQPLDTVRTRLVSQGEPKLYRNIPDAMKQIYTKEGVLAFYKGTVPAIMLVAPGMLNMKK
jgi:solute carrier family 25 thiamine pyrophosphate transporter 19